MAQWLNGSARVSSVFANELPVLHGFIGGGSINTNKTPILGANF
jgi:hypothetical protein